VYSFVLQHLCSHLCFNICVPTFVFQHLQRLLCVLHKQSIAINDNLNHLLQSSVMAIFPTYHSLRMHHFNISNLSKFNSTLSEFNQCANSHGHFTHIAPLHCFHIITFYVRNFSMVCLVFIQPVTTWNLYPHSLL
jgi:hypothetical protein